MILPALTKPREPIEQALVGPSFENIYIASTISTQPGEELEGYSTAKWLDNRTAEGSVFVADSKSKRIKVIVKNMRCVALMPDKDDSPFSKAESTSIRKLTSQQLWKVDVDLLAGNSVMKLSEYIDAFAHKRPEARILALDYDTCGLAPAVLRALCAGRDKQPRCASFTYTNGLARVGDPAYSTLVEHDKKVFFQPINIQENLAEQDFESGSYDLVIVNLVSHLWHISRHGLQEPYLHFSWPSQASLGSGKSLCHLKALLAP